MDSILESVKSNLGVELDYSGFDNDIITFINTALMELNQLGVGPEDGLKITSIDDEWTDLLTQDINLEGAKGYIYLKTKILFDPPTTSFILDDMNRQLTEMAWRLSVQIDSLKEEEGE